MKMIILALALIGGCKEPIGEPEPEAVRNERVTADWSAYPHVGAPVTSFAGVIDPTNQAWAGPGLAGGMVACSSSCSAATADRTRGALQATIDYAASSLTPRVIHIPAGQYPIDCKSGQAYGINFSNDSNVTIEGYNVTLRFTGNLLSQDCAMFLVANTSHVKLRGLTFSMRDVTNASANAVALKVGDGGSTSVDDVALTDVQFVEGVGGDFVRLDGGTSAATVTKVAIERSRFEGSARGGVDVRPGVQFFRLAYNFFRSNANRDIWFEDTGDGPIGRATIIGNMIETDKAVPAVTLAGHGGAFTLDQLTFTFNRIIPPVSAANAANTTAPAGGGVLEGSGLSRVEIAYNSFLTNRTTSDPTIKITGNASDIWLRSNSVDRRGASSNAAVIKVSDDGVTSPTRALISSNRVRQYSGTAPGIDISGCDRCSVLDNSITYHASTADSGATGFVGVYCAGGVKPCSGTYQRNAIRRDDQDIRASINLASVTANDNTVCEVLTPGQEGNTNTLQFIGDAVSAAGTTGGTFYAPIVHFKPAATTVAQAETLLNLTSCHVKTPGTASNVLQAGDAFGPSSLSGGVAAGRPLAGFEILKGAGTTVNRTVLRDNWIDGARDMLYSDADGAVAYPETYPLWSGNSSTGTTNEFEGGITTWTPETTSDAETLASGALSVSKSVSFLTTANTVSYSLADGISDRFVKLIKIKSTTGTPSGTLTPAHFADGTIHTITWTAAGGWARLRWDASSTTYRLVGSSGVTIN